DVVESDALLETALAFAERFHEASTETLGLAKGILNQSFNLDARALLDMEASAQALAVNTDYHRAAVDRFMNKEPLRFAWENFGKPKTVTDGPGTDKPGTDEPATDEPGKGD